MSRVELIIYLLPAIAFAVIVVGVGARRRRRPVRTETLMPKVQIESDEQWHELRKRNVGGSDIAALFGASPWMTEFTLWAEKSGITEYEVEENNKMALGKYLEPYIAERLAKELGWYLLRSREYHLSQTRHRHGLHARL